jgi:hypothetical protein
LKFDFGAGVVISECIFQQQNTSSHGTWIWQGSNNDADWTDVGASFALGGSVKQTITSMNGNETEYRYYRTLGVSGNSSTSPYIYEFDFKVGVESSGDTYDESLTLAISVISVQSASTEMSAGLSLGITADQGSGNIAEMDATIALSLAAAILQSESIEGAPQTYNELVTIAAKMGMSRSAIGSLQEAITLATLEGVGLTSQAIMVNALILQIVSSMDESFSVFVIATGNKLQFVFKKRKDHFTQ